MRASFQFFGYSTIEDRRLAKDCFNALLFVVIRVNSWFRFLEICVNQ